jgi:type I restriction enzyme R subunit
MSQFAFVRTQWPEVFDAAARAESAARSDPRASCFYARRALELAVIWIYKHDPATTLPYQEQLSALIHDPTFKQTVGPALFAKARLITRLFKYRLELLEELDTRFRQQGFEAAANMVRDSGEPYAGFLEEYTLRLDVADRLRAEVDAMNVDNFIVRPQRRLVEKWRSGESWRSLTSADLAELARALAPLPNELPSEEEEAKRFDSLMLRMQLARLQGDHRFARLAEQLRQIAALLEEKKNIPMIRAELPLILEIQSDDWWQDTTVAMFENVRKRLRSLVCLIEKKDRWIVYTDFQDELGDEVEVALGPFASAGDFEKFRAKARQFLREHEDHVAVRKVRTNKALTSSDLAELERILLENGIGTAADLQRAAESNHGLGLFVRSLVGLDRGAAKQAFATFLSGKTLNANQIEFVNMIVDHLTENGAMNPALLYSSPYTDFSPRGVDGLFGSTEAAEIVSILRSVSRSAAA